MAEDRPADWPIASGSIHGFSLDFRFPVFFTRGTWNPRNPLFLDTVARLEPGRRHRVLIVIDDRVAATHPNLTADIQSYFAAHAARLELAAAPLSAPGGEASKNDVLYAFTLLKEMNGAALDRQSFVVAIGGGAVLDVVSFAAALCHRGVRTIRMPTTVLSQADSGIAVKNGVNLFGKKNFIGTFMPPFAVINDFQFLATLDRRDRIAGISEAVKVALLRDAAFFDYLELHAEALAAGRPGILEAVVRRCAELHLAHICGSGDPFELGSARPLDFGHWSAHKLEAMTSHSVRHGEAVAIGMALDILYSVKQGFLAAATAERILRLLERVGFRLWHDALLQESAGGGLVLLAGLQEFREHLGGELHITLVRDIGTSFEVTEMDDAVVLESLFELSARAATGPDAPQPVTI
jgi:3-dehydroquinate synthase